MDYNSWSLVGQVSVCLYAPSTAENLHAPSTAVLTLHLNTVLSCNWTAYRYAIVYVFFLGGQLVLICVSTGPLALPKIDFSVCTHSFQPESTYFFSWSSVCLSVRHYYSGKFTCTINTSPHFGFEYALVMQCTVLYCCTLV